MRYSLQILLLIAFALILFSGCSKPNDFSTSYLKGKIDGVAFECTSNISANKPMPIPGSGSDPNIIITGNWPMYSIKLNIYGEGSSINTGVYVFQIDKNRSATILNNGVESYYAGNGSVFLPQLYGSGSISITEISDKYVKGTFEFTTAVNSTTGNLKTVTDGEFYIKRS